MIDKSIKSVNIDDGLKYDDQGPIGYLTISEFADKHDRSQRQIRRYLSEGRIEGAIRFGNRGDWFIPIDSEYPDPKPKKTKTSWKDEAKENQDVWIKKL